MTHQAINVLLLLGLFIAYFVGKFRGFNDGKHIADDLLERRNRELDEMVRTGKAVIEIKYTPVDFGVSP